jgi:predicted permease
VRDWEQYVRSHLLLPDLARERESRIVRELAAHLEDFYSDAIARGLSEPEADAYARRQITDWPRLAAHITHTDRPHVRSHADRWSERIDNEARTRGGRWLVIADLWQDVRYARRQLASHPGFTAVVVLTLALGIGANTAIFSVVHAVLLDPLPYPDSDRLVMIWNTYGTDRTSSSPPDYFDRLEAGTTLEHVAAFRISSANLTGRGEPVRLDAARVTASFFPTLGVEAEIGRVFRQDEDAPGRDDVAVLSHGSWTRWFGGDAAVVGQTLRLNDRSVEIVGVMPAGFSLLFPAVEIWMPMAFASDARSDTNRGNEYLSVMARLREGVTLEQAHAEMRAIAAASIDTVPSRRDFLINARWSADVVTLREEYAGDLSFVALVLFGAVIVVLLIACANVANLLLARAAARETELSVRQALGAGRGRLLRQLLVESLCLSLAGGLVGLLMAASGIEWLRGLRSAVSPLLGGVGLHIDVLAFAAAVTVGTTVLFGLLPALSLTSHRRFAGLRGAGRGAARTIPQASRRALVVAEVAMALLLLVAAGLLIRSFQHLLQVHPGFETDGRLTFRTSLPVTRYPEPSQQQAFQDDILARLSGLPGVRSVGSIQSLPVAGTRDTATIHVEERPVPPGGVPFSCEYRFISPDYVRAMGIPLVKGRPFNASDRSGRPLVVLVDEAAARTFWPGKDPIGRRIGFSQKNWREVVGVVGSVRNVGLDIPSQGQVYIPHAQNPLPNAYYVVHAEAQSAALVPGIRTAVREVDPSLPVYDIQTMEARLADSLVERRLATTLLAAFAGVALTLVAVGIYGVISFLVRQRTQEMGIRLALGAHPRQVLRLVVWQGMGMTAAGLTLGMAGAAVGARVLEKLLFGVRPNDPLTLAVVAALVSGVALLACWVPARRAMRVDPIVALRSE